MSIKILWTRCDAGKVDTQGKWPALLEEAIFDDKYVVDVVTTYSYM